MLDASDPQLAARGQLAEIEHPDGQGPIPTRGVPIRFPGSPGVLRTPAPRVGQHTDAVLGELLGIGEPEIEALRARGAI
jgi:CoA:oxalate CoA-transferase